MSLLSVEDATAQLLDGITAVAGESVGLDDALGRVLAADLAATRTQPPFAASAMDGYAVRTGDAGREGADLMVIGTSRAGERFDGSLGAGQAVRIFTGAPVPDGADAILIQENATRDGDIVTVTAPVSQGLHVRPAGLDFKKGEVLLEAGLPLGARAIALAASMNYAQVPVRRRPRVAILATGDELVPPGGAPGPDQIIASNSAGIAALVRQAGGQPVDLGIAPDDVTAIGDAVARAGDADILTLIGGASVGDHDLVQEALVARGMTLDFWRIAMRPGKPLMVGHLQAMRVLGLPGNPVSAMVCGHIFLKPLIRAMLGLEPGPFPQKAILGADMAANDRRQDYVRARLSDDDGRLVATPFDRQDSAMMATLARADALIIRPPHAAATKAGAAVELIRLDD
ncbi:MAG: molybdopterin molybdotransferase MoeA [Hyphomicrobiales bacterium]|nr:molybdopterin molybdotransferase MoeA [Hyphomicrobiales bacterium]